MISVSPSLLKTCAVAWAALVLSGPAKAVPIFFENFQAVGFPGPNPGWTHSGQFGSPQFGQGSLEDSAGGNNFIDINNNVTPGSGQSTFVGPGGLGSLPAFGAGILTFSFDYTSNPGGGAFLELSGPGLATTLSSGPLPENGGFPNGFVSHVVASVVTAGSAGGGAYTFTFGGQNFRTSYDNLLLDFTPAAVTSSVPEINGHAAAVPLLSLALILLMVVERRRMLEVHGRR